MDIFKIYESAADPTTAPAMAAYMKNNFIFLGIPKSKRAEISKAFLKQKKLEKAIDWAFIRSCYAREEREFHYLALDYLLSMQKHLQAENITEIERLITTHSWWDTVDTLDEAVGFLYLSYPETRTIIQSWMDAKNIWLKRVSINFQLKFKEKTDTQVLAQAILHNLDSKEFFVQKAIGWALREYSKTDPVWVKSFVASHALAPLSKREASKYIE